MASASRAFAMIACALCAACEADVLTTQEPPPDAGFAPDAEPAPDAEVPDAGFAPDAEPAPDAFVPPPAREPIYIHTGSELYSYDAADNQVTRVGAFRTSNGRAIEDMADIAIDLDGNMIGGTVAKDVYAVDPLTATCYRRFAFGDMLHGLTFLSDGTLVVAGERVSLVDPMSGRVRRTLVDGSRYQTSGDIVGLPDGKLYWTVRGDRGEGDRVIRIDPENGSTRVLSTTDVQRIYGLGYADGTLYGFSAEGKVVVIDASRGNVLRERALTNVWWGATTNPVRW